MCNQTTSRIIKRLYPEVIKKTAARCRERGVRIPTFKELRHPELIPPSVTTRLKGVGLWDVSPVNLFRITWKNDVNSGLYSGVNYLEIPTAITGVKARIIGLTGRFFPTGAHKVGAAFGCLVPRLVSGEFDPDKHKAAWPSTGNYCRGGAFDCALLGCTAIAILPAEMSRERFEWLKQIGAEVIATPGCESNVKEIYDKCWELKKDPLNMIFNQFDEFGNPIFHYNITGPALEEVLGDSANARLRPAAYVSATGSAGTIGAGDFLKKRFPALKVVATEALQCPTLLRNGFGDHRIEGIGDKHVPWVHNVRNTDVVTAIDDEDCMRILRLFNEPAGRDHLVSLGADERQVEKLAWLGISSICNLLAAIKTAKYFELGEQDVILTVFTDSTDMYKSRLKELGEERGAYRSKDAVADYAAPLAHQSVAYFKELTYPERKAIHNLKYYTWVEQQGKTAQELNQQWDPEYWRALFEDEVVYFDQLIEEFNRQAGAKS
ncbi:MAG TPA: pyridoxal-phosphate dependent enzyme [Candidatus Paceibacterota bacterium]|nr:pyridoxal-phosphate dependent enzyme [Verrucomicrobiota bacterium]HSA11765.1 pyridoxal-phosphate dependent enzyme [Candidatus Paceibacterota bacterium]